MADNTTDCDKAASIGVHESWSISFDIRDQLNGWTDCGRVSLMLNCVGEKDGNTRYSQSVTHTSTNRAQRCLTSVIRREPVFPTWYGRRQADGLNKSH